MKVKLSTGREIPIEMHKVRIVPRIIRVSTNSQEKGQAPPNSRLTNLKRKNGADPNEVYA